ncbi:hypothetical protein [Streptomyces goshikiensis]|uniref:hypothetical protein n=1 Tax=Streptomyces goshikiensis TaxID=1942 RepID=UPI002ADF262D|nr:hypothetical protein [Streptomyces goshikiensis]
MSTTVPIYIPPVFRALSAGPTAAPEPARPNPFADVDAVRAIRQDDLPPLTTHAIRVLGQIHQAQEDHPEIAQFLGFVKEKIWKAGDSTAILGEVLALMEQKQLAPCPVYSWCCKTGEHEDHSGRHIWATCEDAYGREVLPVGLIEWGSGVKVGLLDLEAHPH